MTKPIEGWVLCEGDQLLNYEHIEVFRDAVLAFDEVYKPRNSHLQNGRVRPVKITFTDKVNRIEDAIPEDERIVAAIRKERERIYNELKELNSDDNPFFRGVRNGQIRDVIFGEEK